MRNVTHTMRTFPVYNLVLVTWSILTACTSPDTFDTLYYHFEAHAVAGEGSEIPVGTASWVGVKDGKIAQWGTYQSEGDLPDAEEKIDLNGADLYPGLIDAHGHLFGYAQLLSTINLVGAQSKEECLERIRAFKAAHPDQEWLIGRGWDQNDWPIQAFPTAADLAEFEGVYIYLTRIDGHAAWVNEAVMQKFQLEEGAEVPGGQILDGVLIDRAEELVQLPEATNAYWRGALLQAQDSLLKYGLTAMTDAGLSTAQILLLDSMQSSGQFHLVVNAMISNNETDLAYFEEHGPIEKPLLRVKSVKAYLDGALGSRGALLRLPYHDLPSHYGLPLLSPEALNTLRDRCVRNGWQLCVHAIGDSAHHVLLESFQELTREEDLRFRVEHAQIMTPEDSAYYSHPNIVASVQPTHATSDMYWAEDRLGPERIHHAYSYQRLHNSSAHVAYGTDFPIEHIDPLATFFAATTRQDAQHWPEEGFLPDQRVHPETALRAMTEGAAYSAFGEKDYGSLKIGQMANFTVLNTNLLEPIEGQRESAKVLRTIVQGKVLYEESIH